MKESNGPKCKMRRQTVTSWGKKKKMYAESLGSRCKVAKREKELYRQAPPGWVRGRAISHVVNEEGGVSQRFD